MRELPLILVGGPTASGKSALGVRLALALDGEIISIDSVQAYRGCDIGSAKVHAEDRGGVPHHMLDVLAPTEPCDAAWFTAHVRSRISDIQSRRKLPILVAGTTMYVTILMHGIAPAPPRSWELRALHEGRALEELYRELSEKDPRRAAQLHPNDRLRIVRALEVLHLTARAPSELHTGHGFKPLFYPHSLMLILQWPRPLLYERINARSEAMTTGGLVEETRRLIRDHGPQIPPLRALGYKQAAEHLEGKIPHERLAAEISLHTRRYAKRQLTYWRNEPVKRCWLCSPAESAGSEAAMQVTFEELVDRIRVNSSGHAPAPRLWRLDAQRL